MDDLTTALGRAKAAASAQSFRTRMVAAGVTDQRALDVADAADRQIASLQTQLQARCVQLQIARRTAVKGATP